MAYMTKSKNSNIVGHRAGVGIWKIDEMASRPSVMILDSKETQEKISRYIK